MIMASSLNDTIMTGHALMDAHNGPPMAAIEGMRALLTNVCARGLAQFPCLLGCFLDCSPEGALSGAFGAVVNLSFCLTKVGDLPLRLTALILCADRVEGRDVRSNSAIMASLTEVKVIFVRVRLPCK